MTERPRAATAVESEITPRHPVVAATCRLMARYLAQHPAPVAAYDEDWPSPCEIGSWFPGANDEPVIRWHPVPRWDAADCQWPHDFDGLEDALETRIHPDFKALFSHWSDTLELTAEEGHVSLLQVWNRADVDRYVENLIGHVLLQQRAQLPLTLFFACTEPDSEYILSLDNDSGSVMLELPGHPPTRQVAATLPQFLDQLVPATAPTL